MQERFGKTKFIYSQILERQSLHSKRGHKEGIMVVCSTKQVGSWKKWSRKGRERGDLWQVPFLWVRVEYPSKKAWDLVGIVDVTRSQSGQKGLLHQGPALSLLLLVIWPRCWETVRQDVEATGNREALRFMMHKHITGFHFLNQWQKNTARFT